MPPPPKPTRKVGAPRGNHNALKHGFYSRYFRSGELADLDAVNVAGLHAEIVALRVYVRRLVERFGEGLDQYDTVIALDALGLAAIRLASLLKTQRLLDGQDPNTATALAQAISAVTKELGLQDRS